MSKTIVITGGTGYIGSAVVQRLVARGDQVVALVRSDASAAKVEALGAAPLRGELTDAATLRDAAIGADAAIHVGATNDAGAATADLAAARALLEGLSGKPYVHTGGCWVYGSTDGVVDETAPLAPPQITAWRIENEREVLAAQASGGHPVVVQPGLVAGHRGGIPQFLFVGDDASLYLDDGAVHWSLVHLDDIADLYLLALDDAAAGSTYLGVGQILTSREVAQALAADDANPSAVASTSLETLQGKVGPLADALTLDQQLTSAKAEAELGWAPAHTDLRAALAAGA